VEIAIANYRSKLFVYAWCIGMFWIMNKDSICKK